MITYIPPFSGSFSPGHQRPQRRCRPPSQKCPARCSSSWRPGQVLHGAWGGLGFRVGHYDSNNKNTNSNNNNSNNNSNNDNTNYDDHKDIIIHTHIYIYGPKKPNVSWFFYQHLWWSLPSMTSKNWIPSGHHRCFNTKSWYKEHISKYIEVYWHIYPMLRGWGPQDSVQLPENSVALW